MNILVKRHRRVETGVTFEDGKVRRGQLSQQAREGTAEVGTREAKIE